MTELFVPESVGLSFLMNRDVQRAGAESVFCAFSVDQSRSFLFVSETFVPSFYSLRSDLSVAKMAQSKK